MSRKVQYVLVDVSGRLLQRVQEGIPVWGSSPRSARKFPSERAVDNFCKRTCIVGIPRPLRPFPVKL